MTYLPVVNFLVFLFLVVAWKGTDWANIVIRFVLVVMCIINAVPAAAIFGFIARIP